MKPWYREPALTTAASALGIAAALVMWGLFRLLAADPLAPSHNVIASQTPLAGIAVVELPATLVTETVDHDPFHPERRRPTTPFRMPGVPASAPTAAPTPVAALRVLGTVVTPGEDAFALCQLGNEPPKVVRMGGKVGDFTLRKIEPGRAVFLSPDGETIDVRVSKAGS